MKSIPEVRAAVSAVVALSRAKADIYKDLGLSDKIQSVKVELETGWTEIPNDVEVDLIAVVLQAGFNREANKFRVIVGLGGIEFKSGWNDPKICYAALWYLDDLTLLTVDYYLSIR